MDVSENLTAWRWKKSFIQLESFWKTRRLVNIILHWSNTIWLFNIAMENPGINGGFNGKIIYKWASFHGYVK